MRTHVVSSDRLPVKRRKFSKQACFPQNSSLNLLKRSLDIKQRYLSGKKINAVDYHVYHSLFPGLVESLCHEMATVSPQH